MRFRHIFLVLLAVSELSVSRAAVADDRPRRVLILDSFARGVAPFSEYILAFRSELRDRWPGPLDLFEVSLESARSPGPEDDASMVNFLAARLTRDPVDLVAVFGDPAMRFARRHRQRLFPDVPLLISGVEERRLLPEFLGPKTAIGRHSLRSRMQSSRTSSRCCRPLARSSSSSAFPPWSDSGAMSAVARSHGSRTACSSAGSKVCRSRR